MKDDKLLNGLEFIDAELIEAADRIPEKRNKVVAIGWYAAALGMAAVIAIVMMIAYKWGSPRSGDIRLHNPEQPTIQQTVYPTAPTNIPTEPTQQTQPKGPISMDAVSYLTLDVNPSVQFAIESGLIKDCIALNDDGEYILENLKLAGMTIEEALPMVINEMIEQGYLDTEYRTPVMLLSVSGDAQANELLRTAVTAASNKLTEKKIATYIVTKQVNDPQIERMAGVFGISAGKMQYVIDILRRGAELSLGEASTWSIVELFNMDVGDRTIEPAYKPGDYEEYAEKVLFVSGYKSYIP